MAEYKLDGKKLNEFKNLVERGIGYNIPYAKGTFNLDKNGKLVPAPKKFKMLYEDIMSKYIPFITIEGGKRGGKDVYGLWCWANFLMSTPDKLHIVTGQTINHAISTVLKADGFGLEYLLPHGEKILIDNNPVFRFTDWYGVVKEVRFYAGAEVSDNEKFRGISFGSAYCNEAIKQHINTIIEAKDRTMASKWRKVIHTQNPLAGTFGYYEEYEKPLIINPYDFPHIEEQKEKYNAIKSKIGPLFLTNYAKVKNFIEETYVKQLGLKDVSELKNDQRVYERVQVAIRNKNIEIEKQIYAKAGLEPPCFKFEEYYPNPNGIKNGKFFRYYHFDMYDNLSMTDQDRQNIVDTSDTTSVQFRRDILGIRASADNAIYDTFTDKNILHGEIPQIYSGDRYLCVDYGMKNDFVVLDCEVESDFTCNVWEEFRVNGRALAEANGEGNYIPPTNAKYVEDIKKLINKRNNGSYLSVIVDPSATGLINEMIINGLSYKKAKNDVGVKAKDKPDKRVDKSLSGIWLVRDGFAKGKIRIHESCRECINEHYGYALDPKKLLIGVEEPIKVNDHSCLVGETLISTDKSAKMLKDIKVGDTLVTINEEKNKLEYDIVEDVALTQEGAFVYRIELENGSFLDLTADHQVFTKEGRKMVKDLTENDELIALDNEVDYIDNNAYFNGYTFTLDKKKGYYLSTVRINGRRQRLHRYVWEFYNGKIPSGYEIHHIDFNKFNNEIYNLQLLTKHDHVVLHNKFKERDENAKYKN